jgi:NDP-sugar pyrophosphorylase family protein
MLIFIPMAGFGDRYLRAGFKEPKPLIPVDGVPMIERILGDFPKDARFLFGVNAQHAKETKVLEVLKKLRPNAEVVVLTPHKDGPIQTVLSCAHAIPDDESVLLNYCDFGVDWDFAHFAKWLDDGKWDGAMTAYKGFHPHSLGPTLYAYMRNEGDRVTEIREKHHFTANKFDEYASSGLYWFRRGKDLKRIAQELKDKGERVNGEFYVSMAMQQLIEQGGKVGVYPLKHFYQWGTPEDLRDYDGWAKAMRALDPFLANVAKQPSRSAQVVPMAGRGQRFLDQGYEDPKPLVDTAGRPMIEQAIRCLPTPTKRVLIAQGEHARDRRFKESVARLTGETRVIELDHVTEGQACTAELGIEGLPADMPVLFAPCDTGYVYDPAAWRAREEAGDADLIVWTARGHLPALWRPQMYGWLQTDAAGNVVKVAVKKQVEGVPPAEQGVVVGTFWFSSVATFAREVGALVKDNDRVNNEFYIDTIARRMVEQGKRVKAFVLDKYVPWGTPEELKTFLYWNEVFRAGKKVD